MELKKNLNNNNKNIRVFNIDIDIDFSNFEKNNDACTGHVKSNTNDCGSLLCKSCLSHVTLYQIDFNEAFKICTNVQCEQSLTVDLTSCLIKRDFNRNRQCAQPTQDESANLGVIISNIIESKLHKIDSLLETTSITSEAESVINAEIQQPSNTQLDTNGNNNDFLSDLFDFVQSSDDVASTDNHQDHTNISLPSSPSNDEPLLTTTQLLNNELTNFTSATNDVQIDNNIVFDDNFISSLDDLLTDCEPTFGADFLLANSQSNAENTPGFKSQLLNVSSDTSQSLSLTELKPISQTDFYARMASDVYSNDFLNTNTYETFNQETNPIDANIQPIEDSSQEVNTTLISHSNRNNSSITISKVVTKTERTAKNKVQKESDLFMKIENDPPIEISIDQSKLKITDNMKEVIDLLATQSTPKQVSLKSKITNSQWTPKTADNDTISLLEWEKSAKNSRSMSFKK